MLKAPKQFFILLSFSRQFMLAIIVVLLFGMLTIGSWMGQQIETSSINRAAAISAVYIESLSAAQLQNWQKGEIVSDEMRAVFDRIFIEGPMHREVLRFKLWDASGRIDYSTDHSQIGLRYPLKKRLVAAFSGTVQAKISDLQENDNETEYALGLQLLQINVPIYTLAHDDIIGVAEFYLSVDNLKQEIHDAQKRSWILVGFSTIAIYLLLFGLVSRANNTIQAQERDLHDQLKQLRAALDENSHMREQLREAGVRLTSLNEEFLVRIAADLHDGPAQSIAFALMRFDEFASTCRGCSSSPNMIEQDLPNFKLALQSSLDDIRRISSGLALPGIEELSLADSARRAIRHFEGLSGQLVRADIDNTPDSAPLSVKITVYRLLQESLNNCRRHAPGDIPVVQMQQTNGQVQLSVTDHGTGFDPNSAALSGRLGLAFMRERVRLLGGIFEIESSVGHGTCIRARLPLSTDEMLYV